MQTLVDLHAVSLALLKSAATGLPLYDREGLATPENAIKLIGLAQQHLESMKQLDTSGIDHVDIA